MQQTASTVGIKAVNKIVITVTDQDRALAFYRDQLGLQVITDATQGEMRWLEVALEQGGATIVLTADSQHPGKPGGSSIILRVDDIDAVVDELTTRGVELNGEIHRPGPDDPWPPMAFLSDPDGNGIGLAQRTGADIEGG